MFKSNQIRRKPVAHREQLQLRLPEELKDWIVQEAARNCSSQNSEVIRVLRAAKEKLNKDQSDTQSG